MWHVLHVILRLLAALLGLFCVATAVLLYPDQEGKIQSKLEDFWIRIDDYQKLALSKHAAFMTGVSQLESRLLDHIFDLIVGAACTFVRRIWVRRIVIILVLAGPAVQTARMGKSDEGNSELWLFGLLVFGGIAFDIAFIALTRRLLRWAGQMTSFTRVAGTVFLTVMLATAMIQSICDRGFVIRLAV